MAPPYLPDPEDVEDLLMRLEQDFDHDEFGSLRPKLMNVIDSNILAQDSCEKPVSALSHLALEVRFVQSNAYKIHTMGDLRGPRLA